MEQINVQTQSRIEFIDITAEVRNAVEKTRVKEGVCYVYVPHTTAGVMINENADPSVAHDIKSHLGKLIPSAERYTHAEGNADAHIKAALVGCSQMVLILNGTLMLGTWQGIFLCEFDGPRNRRVYVRAIAG